MASLIYDYLLDYAKMTECEWCGDGSVLNINDSQIVVSSTKTLDKETLDTFDLVLNDEQEDPVNTRVPSISILAK